MSRSLPVNEVAELELPTQENFRTDLRTLFQGAIRVALEVALEDEIRAPPAEPPSRARGTSRSIAPIEVMSRRRYVPFRLSTR